MNTRKPPRLACWLLRLRLSRSRYECIAGDLFEEFHDEGRSNSWFWQQTLSALGPRYAGIEHLEPQSQGATPMTLFSDLLLDVRYATRTLRKNPSFAIVAVLALALGIGCNTGIFTILNAVALRPLPVADAGRVVAIYQSFRGKVERNAYGSVSFFSYPEYLEYRDSNQVFSGLAAYASANASLGGAEPRRVDGQIVSCNFFTVIGRMPVLGRGFAPDECSRPDAAAVAILSNGFWRTQFQADPRLVGSTILLNRRSFTVIGIAPPGFTGIGAAPSEYWAPLTMQNTLLPTAPLLADPNVSWLEMLGRLKPGVSIARARAQLAVIAGRIDRLNPGRTTTLAVDTASLARDPESRTLVLAGGAVALLAVGLVLLIACANVANLLLARASARQREIAIRLSTGASRGRLVRQLLTESILISLTGGALGSLFAVWSFQALVHAVMSNLPAGVPPLDLNLAPDLRVLAYAVGISAATGFLFGLAPALQATHPDLSTALKGGSALGGAGVSRRWLRNGLVAAQVAICLVLLIAAGLIARGLQSAQTLDPGFSTRGVLTASFDLEQQGYDQPRAARFQRELMERVAAIPGVDSVAEAGVVPLEGSSIATNIDLGGTAGKQVVKYDEVSPSFFSLLGIPIVRGRGFTEAESREGAPVAIVSQATAKRFWPNRDPLGETLRRGAAAAPIQIIGIVKDIRATDLPHQEPAFFYFPGKSDLQLRMHLLAHVSGAIADGAKLIRQAAHSVDPNVIATVKPLAENFELWQVPSRILASLTGALGLLGLLLASAGIYGVVSYAVSRRIREIGIRMTLGANAPGILSMILKQGMRPVMVGLTIGFAICAATSRLLSILLYGVSPFDPLTFGGVAVFLAAVAFLACYLPARRATKVDPMEALRYE